jgi:hypothetical protein
MRQSHPSLRATALACALCFTSLAAFAQAGDRAVPAAVAHKQKSEIARGDPARWYKGDSTDAARMRTLKKEIAAAYTEAKTACHKQPSSRRSSCLQQARSTWQHDMANAPALLASAPQAEIVERVSTVGSSQAGQTAAGAGATQPEPVTEQKQQYGGQSGQQSGQSQSGQTQSGQPESGTLPPQQQSQQPPQQH